MTLKTAIYIRVSSEEQTQGFSLAAQEKASREMAAAKSWQVANVYIDAGYSARTDNRPQFKRMIADAQDGQFNAIIVHKFDRFARNRKDAVTYKALLKQCGVSVLSVSEPIDPDDPAGVITEGMLEVMAEWYSANLSRETIKGKKARAEAGYQNNTTPFGYTREKGKDTVAKFDPINIEGYRLAVRRALEGATDREIAWALNEQGYRMRGGLFSKDTVRAILENRFYLGEVCYRRKTWFPGRHPAAIDSDSWERIQAIRRARATRPDHSNFGKRVFPLTTVLYCAECGGKIRGGGDRKQKYYRCTGKEHGLHCSQPATQVAELETQIGDYISGLRLPEDWKAKALDMMGEDSGEVERIEAQRRKLQNERKRARDLFVAGDMPEAEYNQHKERIEISLSNLHLPNVPDLSEAALILSDFRRVWQLATDAERKKIVTAILARVWIKDRSVVGIEARPGPYYVLAAAQNSLPVGSASGIILFPPGAQVLALFKIARQVASEEIAK